MERETVAFPNFDRHEPHEGEPQPGDQFELVMDGLRSGVWMGIRRILAQDAEVFEILDDIGRVRYIALDEEDEWLEIVP